MAINILYALLGAILLSRLSNEWNKTSKPEFFKIIALLSTLGAISFFGSKLLRHSPIPSNEIGAAYYLIIPVVLYALGYFIISGLVIIVASKKKKEGSHSYALYPAKIRYGLKFNLLKAGPVYSLIAMIAIGGIIAMLGAKQNWTDLEFAQNIGLYTPLIGIGSSFILSLLIGYDEEFC